MTNRTLAAFAAALLLSACGGGSTTEPSVSVVSVTVTPIASTLPAIGSTVQLTASARDSDGNPVTGVTATWASADPSVATVSSSGLVTAVSTGASTITATISGVSGSGVVTVEDGVVACATPTTVSLEVGEHAGYNGDQCVVLPSGAGHRYRVVVVRPSESESATDVVTATLNVLGLGAVAQAPAWKSPPAPRPVVSDPASEALLRAARRAEATSRFHMRLREQEEELYRRVGANQLLPSNRGGAARVAAVDSPEKIQVDISTEGDCSTTPEDVKTAVRVAENDDMVIYQDSTQRATTPVTESQASRMLQYYSAYSRDMLETYFGTPPDLDANGKLIVFVSPAATDPNVAFVWSGDFLPKETCAASNEREIIYFNNDVVQDLDGGSTFQALETLAHEAKHVVSLYNRLAAFNRIGTVQFHPLWIEEGTAEVSGEMSSRIAWAAQGGPDVGDRVVRQDFIPAGSSSPRFTPENYGVVIRMARVVWYLSSQPNALTVKPQGADPSNTVYGPGWLFHRWLGDAYGAAGVSPMADASLFLALNDSLAARGTAGLLAETGKSFADLLEEYAVALALHEIGAPEGSQAFSTYDFFSSTTIFQNPNPLGDFPWPVTTTPSGTATRGFNTAQYTGAIGASGIRIHDLLSDGTGTGAQITLSMPDEGRILVVRIQ